MCSMKRDELFEQFMRLFPESSHPLDHARFIRYAIQCAKDEWSIDEEGMRARGLSEEKISDYCSAYSWIRQTVDLIKEEHIEL